MELAGKIALVTGAGHRLGRSIALALAEEGCDLVVHYHGAAGEADRTATEIRDRGRHALLVKANLAQSEGVSSLFQAIDHGPGGPDILVNSAAVMQAVDFLEATEEDWRRTIDLNLKGSFFCLQQAAVRMRQRGGGAIVNISDVAGLRPWKRFPIHSISKSGVEMLTRVAAAALAPEIRVNAVAPGPVLKPEAMPDGRWQDLGSRLPLKHTGQPVDICRSVIFLLKNDFITGETLVVDGGNSLV